jgi:hypothetical protein
MDAPDAPWRQGPEGGPAAWSATLHRHGCHMSLEWGLPLRVPVTMAMPSGAGIAPLWLAPSDRALIACDSMSLLYLSEMRERLFTVTKKHSFHEGWGAETKYIACCWRQAGKKIKCFFKGINKSTFLLQLLTERCIVSTRIVAAAGPWSYLVESLKLLPLQPALYHKKKWQLSNDN